MSHVVSSVGLNGVDPVRVSVEVDVARGVPTFTLVGLPDASVQEARERVRAAIRNSGYQFPLTRKTVSLVPSSVQKRGTQYDLAIAIGLLVASEQCNAPPSSVAFLGELRLDGSIQALPHILPLILGIRACGIRTVVVAPGNASEAAAPGDLEVRTAGTLRELCASLPTCAALPRFSMDHQDSMEHTPFVLHQIRGQPSGVRAACIAAAGEHGLLLEGPPGVGKTLLASSIAGLLPALARDAMLEVSRLHALAGVPQHRDPLVTRPPFRRPHHSCSRAALIGGGSPIRPGEVSLAHRGVLFLDELPLFSRDALDALREPLEHGAVHLRRANESVELPAAFLLVAAMNPCPCGPRTSGCVCTQEQIRRTRARVSGPLLDRIDLVLQLSAPPTDDLLKHEHGAGFAEETLARLARARSMQKNRNQRVANARIPYESIAERVRASDQSIMLLRTAGERLDIRPRALHKALRVARTIADLEGAEMVDPPHISEALQYRGLMERDTMPPS